MHRLLSAALAAIFAFAPIMAQSANRVVIYSGQGWSSVQTNQQARFYRLAMGTWIRDALGPNLTAGGVYTNLSVVPNGGMYLATQPSNANTLGALYQIASSDANAVPASQNGNQLSSDPTIVVIQATQSGPSGAIGPLVAPASGLSQYYIVEAQVQTVDTSPQSLQFYASNKTTFYQTVNTQRLDQITYQLKAGTAGTSPTIPAVDSGWIGVATILIPSGTSTITSNMVTAQPAFTGFVANGSNVTLSGLTLSGTGAGCLQTNSSGVVSTQACTSGLGTVNATNPITATTLGGVATVGCTICVTSVTASGNLSSTGGTTPAISLSANPTFTSVSATTANWSGNNTIGNAGTATSSTNYGALGAFQMQNSLWNGSAAVLNTWGVTSDNTGKLSFQWNAVPKLTLDSSGNATFNGSGSFNGNLAVNGTGTLSVAGTANSSITGALQLNGAATGAQGDLGVARDATHGALYFARSGTNYIYFDGANFNFTNNLVLGSSTYGATSATVNGQVNDTNTLSSGWIVAGSASVGAAGDLGAARSASSGLVAFGSGVYPQGYIDYGVNHAGAFTLTNGTAALYANSLIAGSSTYGPTSANINGGATLASGNSLNVAGNNQGVINTTSTLGLSGNNATGYGTILGNNAAGGNPAAWQVQGTNLGSITNSGSVNLFTINAPAAAALSQSAGGTMAATTYYVKTVYNNANGTTTPSAESSLAVAANNVLVVTSPTAYANASSYDVYVSTSTGAETKQTSAVVIGSNWTEPTTGLVAGAALPTVNTTMGAFATGSSTYGPSSATVNGTINDANGLSIGNNGTYSNTSCPSGVCIFLPNQSTGAGSAHQTWIGSNSTSQATQGVQCTVICIADGGHIWTMSIDQNGAAGVYGNVTAAAFYNGSRREWKQDIKPITFDPLLVLKHTEFKQYHYRRGHGDPSLMHVGFIANDTPTVLAGAKHDHFDAGALATVDALAILKLNRRLDGLENMVRILCREKKNRKEKACAAFVH